MKTMWAAWAVLAMLVLGASPARAVLGEYESSVGVDREFLRGEVREISAQGYAIRQITAADGAVIKEYVSPAGLVFGVSWQGRTMPNLEQLLGSYYAPFQQASQARTRRRGPLVVRTDKVVVESGGHMRFFHGRAYVPGLLPGNMTAEVVR